MQSLFAIENVFEIAGRGCVLAPGIPYSLESTIRNGARIVITGPSGSEIVTNIVSFEMMNLRGTSLSHAPFSISSDIKKSQIELGSKVFLLEDS